MISHASKYSYWSICNIGGSLKNCFSLKNSYLYFFTSFLGHSQSCKAKKKNKQDAGAFNYMSEASTAQQSFWLHCLSSSPQTTPITQKEE